MLLHLRALVHRAGPHVEETLKWGMPYFLHRGVLLCSMASFRAHAVFGFWKPNALRDPTGALQRSERTAMGQLGRLTSRADLPKDAVLLALMRDALRLIDEGKGRHAKPPPARSAARRVPAFFARALAKHPEAKDAFDALAPSHRAAYLDWLTEAKTEQTRDRRVLQALERLRGTKAPTRRSGRRKPAAPQRSRRS